jgi:hypothetical protein
LSDGVFAGAVHRLIGAAKSAGRGWTVSSCSWQTRADRESPLVDTQSDAAIAKLLNLTEDVV